jgi:hypothetical protein
MGLLAGVNYDPATAVNKATTALLAMTAMDTTNLSVTFTAPPNGSVLVRIRGVVSGATTMPTILFGVLQSTTVIARQSPIGGLGGTALATTGVTQETLFTVTGLTAGTSYTWNAAYAVQVLVAATGIEYGGPNDTTANNAWGGFHFEVWTASNLLGSKMYDPATAVSLATTADLAMTALDTTNLSITFTAPVSGNILVRMRGVLHGATTYAQVLFGVLEGATVRGRGDPIGSLKNTAVATAQFTQEAEFVITGVTSGSHTYNAAYDVETAVASTGLKYGGPNDAVGNDAFGGFLFEIWSV